MNRQEYIEAVELAKGWQFVPAAQLIKIPGTTEPAKDISLNDVHKGALAMQLISQVDEIDGVTFDSDINGRATVVNLRATVDKPDVTSHHGSSRSDNAIGAILDSGVLK
ncbi:MAG: hypothetical protein GXP16_01460 [Gammaproteobacteria bacterium]|nr:hypothetical protein [Gammaproteobacteria bacterium]